MRFGFPLSYNSDALEALAALMGVGEKPRAEYDAAIELVRSTADARCAGRCATASTARCSRTSRQGEPSKWLTLRALQVLEWAE